MSEQDNPTTEKAGARHNAADMRRLADIHAAAGTIQQAALDLGHTVPVEVQTIGTKAGDIPDAAEPAAIFGVVKAAGDWEIDVLANPYGGPNNGRDSDGEYFAPDTAFHETHIPYPPAVYYHGYGDDKRPMGMPAFIGKTIKRWVDGRGVWYRVALDRSNQFAKRVWEAAQRGVARASSGVVLASHRVDRATGKITSWMNGEISIFETDTGKRPANGYAVAIPALKAVFDQAGLTLPVDLDHDATPQTDTTGAAGPVAVAHRPATEKAATEITNMDEKELLALLDKRDAEKKAQEAIEAERTAKEQERIDNAVKAALEAQKTAYAKNGRLPMGQPAPAVAHFAHTSKYDGLSVDDLGFAAVVLGAAKSERPHLPGVSDAMLQALAIKAAEDKTVIKRRDGTDVPLGDMGRQALKAFGLEPADVLNANKANELDYSTQAGFGDEWVGVQYSNRLWEAIRFGTFVLDEMPSVEVPDGAESIVVAVQGADPTWYKIAQTTDNNATTGIPDATVTASKVATTSKTLSVAKLGARVLYTGELVEDSFIPWAAQVRKQVETSGSETLENVIINGDTEAANSTNINAIDTTPSASDIFMVLNGFRKLALVTNTANSRSAAGSLADTDYLATVKLMGPAGKNARDKSKVFFLPDMNTYWKSLELSNLKSIQSFTNSTIEDGELVKIWGYRVRPSGFMHAASAKLMANSAGKIDGDTDSNNTLGAILAVRPDQWLFGYKRRFTIETTRYARSDSYEITALARVGMVNRDTEASAITYNVGV